MTRKLTIGVSGMSPHTRSVRAMMKQIREEKAHAAFLPAPARLLPATVRRELSRIDALVLMGNDFDIDPRCYVDRYPKDDPKRRIHPKTRSEASTPKSKARGRYEEALLKKALACGMPVLGICAGMQRINIVCGGTLHQHIPDLVGCDKHMQHKQGIAPHIPVVPIVIKEDTMLAEIACSIRMPFARAHSTSCAKVIMENSLHHQSVDKIGAGLRVCAITDTVRMQDGRFGYLAEAIESDPDGDFAEQCILGVQWHPEFGASSLGQRIVQHLIAQARRYAARRTPQAHKMAFRRVRSVHKSGMAK